MANTKSPAHPKSAGMKRFALELAPLPVSAASLVTLITRRFAFVSWLAGRLPAASSIGLELDSTKSTCSPSVSSSRRLLPMVIRPGIGWVKLRRGVDTASRRDTGHAAAPPAGPAVHPVGLSQLRRWPIRPSGAPSAGLERSFECSCVVICLSVISTRIWTVFRVFV